MFSMMPEPMKYIIACYEHVLCRATPSFKTLECQTGSTYSFYRPKDTNKIRKHPFKQLRQKLTWAKPHLQLLLLNIISYSLYTWDVLRVRTMINYRLDQLIPFTIESHVYLFKQGNASNRISASIWYGRYIWFGSRHLEFLTSGVDIEPMEPFW